MLFDTLEENRFLSAGEQHVKHLCQDRLALALRELAAHWKQRGKRRELREGDANTQYFQARTTQRLRHNQIRGIEVGGTMITSHVGKTQALTQHLSAILGVNEEATWDFNLNARYSDHALVALFSAAEALAVAAVRAMNRTSAPGPDGFGSSFFQAAWSRVSPQLMSLLSEFHSGTTQLERLNRAFVVMVPKHSPAITATLIAQSACKIAVSKLALRFSQPGCRRKSRNSLTRTRQASFADDQSQKTLSWQRN